jgi:hypothetical protein
VGLSLSPNGFRIPRGNCLPGKVSLVCPAASLGQRSSILAIAQDAHQRLGQLLFFPGRDQDDACLGNGRRRFCSAIRNYRQAAGNSRNDAAPAAGNGSPYKQQNVRRRQHSRDFFTRKDARNFQVDRNTLQTFSQKRFGIIRMASESKQPQFWNTFRGKANGLGDYSALKPPRFAPCNSEYSYCRRLACRDLGRIKNRFRQGKICAHGDENCIAATGRHPGELLCWNRQHGDVCEVQRFAHRMQLDATPQAFHETAPRVRLYIVEDNGHTCARSAQNSQDAEKAEWKPAAGPSERRVLNESRRAAPARGLSTEFPQRGGPASFVPGNARELKRKAVRTERGAEITAIFLYRVGRLIAPAEQCDARLPFMVFDRWWRDGSIS